MRAASISRCCIALLVACVLVACSRGDNLVPAQSRAQNAIVPHVAHVVPFFSFIGGADGATPLSDAAGGIGGLIGDASTLYGVTTEGGSFQYGCEGLGCGVIYELRNTASGYQEQVLHTFAGTPNGDGSLPFASLVRDAAGSLYGTTWAGGTYVYGTVFKLTPSTSGGAGNYVYSVLYSFKGGADGAGPKAPLIVAAHGVLFGTTYSGGITSSASSYCQSSGGCGTVFELIPSSTGYTERVVYRFTGFADGANPQAGLVAGHGHALYGTTLYGGDLSITYGVGTAFKLVPTKKGYRETTIHVFGIDGARPSGLIADRTGAFYGTTAYGGPNGDGTVFKLARSGNSYHETILHNFNGTDGRIPSAPLTMNAFGTLFGTTYVGGGQDCAYGEGCGVAFQVTQTGAFSVLYRFKGDASVGGNPLAPLLSVDGSLYGITFFGGKNGLGAAFKLSK